jgi:hypothetical protein
MRMGITAINPIPCVSSGTMILLSPEERNKATPIEL